MTVEEKIIKTLSLTGLPVTRHYSNTKVDKAYIVFNYTSYPTNYGDNVPHFEKNFVQIHLFSPTDFNCGPLKKQIKTLIGNDSDFTYPSMTDVCEPKYQHWVFECELISDL